MRGVEIVAAGSDALEQALDPLVDQQRLEPQAGDEAHAGNLFFEVHDVRGRRIVSVDMYVRAEEVPA